MSRIMGAIIFATVVCAQLAVAGGPVGTGKYLVKAAPSLQDSATRLEVSEDLVKEVAAIIHPPSKETEETTPQKAPREEMEAAKTIGILILNSALSFLSNPANIDNVMRILSGR